MSERTADLVLEGGGAKGIGHVGAITLLQERGYTFQRVAGTSAGAIVGALAAAGATSARLRGLMDVLDYRKVPDRGGIDRVPLVGRALSLLLEEGIHEGDYVREFLGNALAELGVETFGDLRDERPGSSLPDDQCYRLVVTATDVTRGELIRLPWDYRSRYGLDPDQQLVADAVRASMSIPFFFEPVRLRAAQGEVSTLVDGGVLSNFPIDVFDRTDGREPRWPTFGVKLLPNLPAGRARLFPLLGLVPRGPVHLLEQLVSTMIVGHDQTKLAQPWVAARTMVVDTDDVSIVEFDLTEQQRTVLYRNGRRAAQDFLAGWDFEAYGARFRPTPAPAART